jgi:hypothetical protein
MITTSATNPTTEDPLTRLLATINRNAEQQRKHHEDRKLAALRRKPRWLDADNHEPDTPEPDTQPP